MFPLDPTVVAVIGTIMGGVGLKVVEHWLGKGKVKVDDARNIRDELRLEIAALRAENDQVETEITLWRDKYYSTLEKLIQLRAWVVTHGLDPPDDE